MRLSRGASMSGGPVLFFSRTSDFSCYGNPCGAVSRRSTLARRLSSSPSQWSLGLMLLALHASFAWGIDEWWTRAFLLAHFGLFLLWQQIGRASCRERV